MTSSLLLLGATSDIGGEIAVRSARGRHIVLAARRVGDLQDLTRRLLEAGAVQVDTLYFDAADLESHQSVIDEATRLAGVPEVAIVAFGILGDQDKALNDASHVVEIATVDYTAQLSILTILASLMRRGDQQRTLVAFSSIAGWRARRANFVYGSTKAGLDAFCQGLADELRSTPLRLITARPGFVIGAMTKGMDPAPLSVTSAEVADVVTAEIGRSGKASRTRWIPGRLRVLAWVMRMVPRPIWARMPR